MVRIMLRSCGLGTTTETMVWDCIQLHDQVDVKYVDLACLLLEDMTHKQMFDLDF